MLLLVEPLAFDDVHHTLWMWVVVPLGLLAAAVLTVRLRLPQLLELPAAVRGLRESDPSADGVLPPAAASLLTVTLTYGAAAAVGAATAVSLGGAGAIAWVWVFVIVIAPLRMGEVLLARTSPPGEAGAETGTLAHRLLEDPYNGLRVLGTLLLLLVPAVGFAYYGGVHGAAVAGLAEQLLPTSAMPVGLAVALAAAGLAIAPPRRVGAVLGWTALLAVLLLLALGVRAGLQEPGRFLGAAPRALGDLLEGAAEARHFTGAQAGEVAAAAFAALLPPLVAATGTVSALHGAAQARTTRRQAATAVLGPVAYGVLTTVIGLSLVATGAFTVRMEVRRPITELTVIAPGMAFDTASQRLEEERGFSGPMRVLDGGLGVVPLELATERGMVTDARFELDDEPADVLFQLSAGKVVDYQRPEGEFRALARQPLEDAAHVEVIGEMLPTGSLLFLASMSHGGGDVAGRLALASLLVLATLGAAAWGWAIRWTLEARLTPAIARLGALVPAAGLALAVGVGDPVLGAAGGLLAGAVATVVSLALIVRSAPLARLARSPKG
ncbi:MAG: hypothetical protein ACFCGT_03615 [Sandaracinaceae bacterium]